MTAPLLIDRVLVPLATTGRLLLLDTPPLPRFLAAVVYFLPLAVALLPPRTGSQQLGSAFEGAWLEGEGKTASPTERAAAAAAAASAPPPAAAPALSPQDPRALLGHSSTNHLRENAMKLVTQRTQLQPAI